MRKRRGKGALRLVGRDSNAKLPTELVDPPQFKVLEASSTEPLEKDRLTGTFEGRKLVY